MNTEKWTRQDNINEIFEVLLDYFQDWIIEKVLETNEERYPIIDEDCQFWFYELIDEIDEWILENISEEDDYCVEFSEWTVCDFIKYAEDHINFEHIKNYVQNDIDDAVEYAEYLDYLRNSAL